MGVAHQTRHRPQARRRNRASAQHSRWDLSRVAQVVPDLPTFAVDDGFSYAVPETMAIEVGSIVRVPLGGRRIRGWVTGLRSGPTSGLKEVIGVSGAHSIFTAELLQTLRWAAVHYVSPLAALIPKAGPPNLPRSGHQELDALPAPERVRDGFQDAVSALENGDRIPPTFIAGSGPWDEALQALAVAGARSGRSTLVVVPTAAECASLAGKLAAALGNRLVSATSTAPAATQTRAWSQVRATPGTVVVGTAEVALWPLTGSGTAVVLEPGRRAMKARQTPTVHVRDLLRRRAGVERIGFAMLGHVPTLESVIAGTRLVVPAGRSWPLVEVVDRNEEPPSGNPIAEGTRAALGGAIRRREPVFVFVSRRGYSPALRCISCGELRRCPQCGSNPGPGADCERCGNPNGPCSVCGAASFAPVGAAVGRVLEELRRTFGDTVTAAGNGGLVQVGTERDIPATASVGLAVAVDADSMLLRPHYRAEEDTLRVLARVAGAVRRGRGHRCAIQTRMPDHRVLHALRHGRGDEIIPLWLGEREAEQLPPYGELLAIEVAGDLPSVNSELRRSVGEGVAVFGPADLGERRRWLVQAPDLRRAKVRLRAQVQKWRDRGATVRVDADPLDV